MAGIQREIGRCLDLALGAIGGLDTVLGRELHRLATDFNTVQKIDDLHAPLIALNGYVKDIL